jgi:hypothetical protein
MMKNLELVELHSQTKKDKNLGYEMCEAHDTGIIGEYEIDIGRGIWRAGK